MAGIDSVLAQLGYEPGGATKRSPFEQIVGGLETLNEAFEKQRKKRDEYQKHITDAYITLRKAGYSEEDSREAALKGTLPKGAIDSEDPLAKVLEEGDIDIRKQKLKIQQQMADTAAKRADISQQELELKKNPPIGRPKEEMPLDAALDTAIMQNDQISAVEEKFPGMTLSYDKKGNPILVTKKAAGKEVDKGMTAESAGKLAMVGQAESDLRSVKEMLFPNGKLDRKLVFDTNFPGGGSPGTKGREVFSKILNAVNAKLRIETGAQANPSEVKNILQRFLPTQRDPDDVALDKINRLEDFMVNTKAILDPAGKYKYVSQQEAGLMQKETDLQRKEAELQQAAEMLQQGAQNLALEKIGNKYGLSATKIKGNPDKSGAYKNKYGLK